LANNTHEETAMTAVALFGAGRIGKIHAANLAAQPGARLKYVVDTHQPRRRNWRRNTVPAATSTVRWPTRKWAPW
jgi:predicted dehydrogenase